MANINQQWKRFVACGCSHGHLADPLALAAVMGFCDDWQPETRIHLGDYIDLTSFRSGAKGTKDEAAPLRDDLAGGFNFLREYRPTHLINGNHDIRAWELADHHNQVIAAAGSSIVNEICGLVRDLNCKHLVDYDINSSWFEFGGVKALHGFMYGEMFIRDHAEAFGNCMIAHGHKTGSATGRRTDRPFAQCVGTLADIPAMRYANRRRATLAWSKGFVFGEYTEKSCQRWLHELGPDYSLPR